jgi:hypothetical protein
LYKYSTEEQNLHRPEQPLEMSWDDELWWWIDVKRRVLYQFGDTSDQLNIWLEDYDAFRWFVNGRFDLEIVQLWTPLESQARWQRINEVDNMVLLSEQVASQALLYMNQQRFQPFNHFFLRIGFDCWFYL